MRHDAKIYEDNYQQDDAFQKTRDELMTEEQQKRVDFYLTKYHEGKANLEERMQEWEEIHRAYKGERTDIIDDDDMEKQVAVNIMLTQIEGQVSSMQTTNIAGSYQGVGFSDQKFARTAGIVGDFILKRNNARQIVKKAGRRYLQFGYTVLTTYWDDEALDNFGLPRLECLKPGTVVFDDKIDDIVDDLERCDYIIHEVGSRSIMWARKKYGDEIADAIQLGNNDPGFEYKDTDNDESFTYLRVWTRNNEYENLQLLEISLCGILLSESDPSEPYYKHIFNRYPFFTAGLYKDESDQYYFGDGRILLSMQKVINKLYDEIILAIKFSSQGRTYADPNSKLNPAEFAEADPSKVIYANNPHQYIKTERGSGLSEVVFSLLTQLLDKVQEVTRFSALMTGNDPGRTMTATQAGIQMQQGITGIDDKRADLSKALGDALSYAIGLCMEFWSAAKAFRVADNDDQFEWIDARQFIEIPELIPASREYIENFKKNNPNAETVPEYMQLEIEDEDGKRKPATKQLELDISVNIGEGVPNNKIALYNIILQLSQLVLVDEVTGQPRPLIGFRQFKQMVEDYLSIKIDDNTDDYEAYQQLQQALIEQTGMMPSTDPNNAAAPLNMNPNIAGMNLEGTALAGGRG